MSTRTARPPRALFARLVDDAAAFPPGNASTLEAVGGHRGMLSTPWEDVVGPLLLPGAALEDVIERLEDDALTFPVALVQAAREDVDDVYEAFWYLTDVRRAAVAGVEVRLDEGWRKALGWGVPVAVEVARDDEDALDDVREYLPEHTGLRAKLRTQATTDAPAPTADQLAAFVVGCVSRGLPFKLTGGMHAAVARAGQDGEEHGCLNVLLATRLARTGGGRDDVAEVLRERSSDVLAGALRGLDEQAAWDVRASFTSFGCCGVEDPVGDLLRLDLLDVGDRGPVPGATEAPADVTAR